MLWRSSPFVTKLLRKILSIKKIAKTWLLTQNMKGLLGSKFSINISTPGSQLISVIKYNVNVGDTKSNVHS